MEIPTRDTLHDREEFTPQPAGAMITPCDVYYSPPGSFVDDVDAGLRRPLFLSDDLLAPAFRGPELSSDDDAPSYVKDGTTAEDATSVEGVTTTVVTGFLDDVTTTASAFFVDV
jgi:hypothetical protein